MSVRRSFIVASLVLLTLAACSSNDTNSGASGSTGAGSPTGTTAPPASESPASGGGTEVESQDSSLGTILVDSKGSTLYVFMNDTGDTSTCTGDCAASWPALIANGEVKGGGAVDASLLSTSARDDGTMQVTYNGHPLYHFSGDAAAGDTNGQGVGGIWFVVSPAGDPIEG
ncbi:MAG: COG4315 family predicted lipoprotein [Actinomycetota bacterium]